MKWVIALFFLEMLHSLAGLTWADAADVRSAAGKCILRGSLSASVQPRISNAVTFDRCVGSIDPRTVGLQYVASGFTFEGRVGKQSDSARSLPASSCELSAKYVVGTYEDLLSQFSLAHTWSEFRLKGSGKWWTEGHGDLNECYFRSGNLLGLHAYGMTEGDSVALGISKVDLTISIGERQISGSVRRDRGFQLFRDVQPMYGKDVKLELGALEESLQADSRSQEYRMVDQLFGISAPPQRAELIGKKWSCIEGDLQYPVSRTYEFEVSESDQLVAWADSRVRSHLVEDTELGLGYRNRSVYTYFRISPQGELLFERSTKNKQEFPHQSWTSPELSVLFYGRCKAN
jgi:hypothetical protein